MIHNLPVILSSAADDNTFDRMTLRTSSPWNGTMTRLARRAGRHDGQVAFVGLDQDGPWPAGFHRVRDASVVEQLVVRWQALGHAEALSVRERNRDRSSAPAL
jgi:hypothetical protein